MTLLATPKKEDILQTEYNVVPYLSFSFGYTHPSHLFTLAKLFGLQPKPIEKANVLELGCASGGNLIPMAYRLPEAKFLGIDLAEKQIEQGNKQIADLKIANITLRHQSIMDFSAKEGKFDYIICHGVYSWVNNQVREKILQICRENLSEHGVAYISYNTLPGWNMINSIRELMSWHTKNIQDPFAKAQQARGVLKFIADGLQDDNSPYSEVLRNEIALLSKQPDNYLLHDHLSSFNQPMYFYQFIEQANIHKLSYLSDAFLPTMFTGNLPAHFSNELNKINNIITIGQYMDFVRNQRFRCTLLCHQENNINRSLKTNDIENFYLQFVGKPQLDNFSLEHIQDGKEIHFVHGNITLTVRNTTSQLAMLILFEHQARSIHYSELCNLIAQRGIIKDLAVIKQYLNDDLNLLRMAFSGLLLISSYPDEHITQIKEKPYVCPLIRYQAKNQNHVTNHRHETLGMEPLIKTLLPYLDGEHDIEALTSIIKNQVDVGQLQVVDELKKPIIDPTILNHRILQFCQQTLNNISRQGLLSLPREETNFII